MKFVGLLPDVMTGLLVTLPEHIQYLNHIAVLQVSVTLQSACWYGAVLDKEGSELNITSLVIVTLLLYSSCALLPSSVFLLVGPAMGSLEEHHQRGGGTPPEGLIWRNNTGTGRRWFGAMFH